MRHVFGGSPADFAMEKVGNQLLLRPAVTGTVWDARTGGTQLTDLTDLTGTPITTVTADTDGAVAFFGPDGVTNCFVDFSYGRRYALTAIDTGATLATFMASAGVANGLATLDGNGHVPDTQLRKVLDWAIATDPAYGAVGNGVADDTAALQAAVNAAAAAQKTLYIPAGTYLVSTPISIPAGQGMAIVGSGWGTSIKLKNASNCFIFAMTGGDTRVTMRNMTLDGNCTGQGTTGTSGGIDGSGAVACSFENIHFIACRDDGLYLGPQTGGAFGHNNRVIGCLFDQSMTSTGPGRGIQMLSNDENQVIACDFEFLGGSGGSGYSTAVAILDRAGTQFIIACNFVGGATNNCKGVRIQDSSSTKITACNFDGTAGDSIFIAGEQNNIVGNTIFSPGEVGTAGQASGIHLEYAAAHNLIQGNTVVSSPTNGRTRSLIREEAMGPAGNNQITGNNLVTKGTLSVGVLDLNAPGTLVRGNLGAGPAGDPVLTAPANGYSGYVGMNYDPGMAVGQSGLTAGVMHMARVDVTTAKTASNLVVSIQTGGATLTAGQNLAGLYDVNGNLLASVADQSTAWTSTGHKVMALASSVALTPGAYFVGLLFNGTTSPMFLRTVGSTASAATVNLGLSAAQLRWGTTGTGLTALPATVTMSGRTASGSCLWAGIS